MATKKKKVETDPTKRKMGIKWKGDVPILKRPPDVTAENITAPEMAYDPMDYTDTDFTIGTAKADKLANRFMTAADYALVDPAEIAGEFGDIDRQQRRLNADLSSELALQALDTELRGLQNFVPAASALKRSTIAEDNTFNQAERLRQIASGDPNLISDLEAQRRRSQAYAEGRVPDELQDRAYELGIRSRAADLAGASGFGVSSLAAAKASELMSAEARIGLSQYGDQLLTSNIGNRANLLLAPTQYSDAGAQVQVTPTMSASQLSASMASEANAGNITARDALQNLTQQQQFKSGLEQEARTINLQTQSARDLNQAKMNLEASTFNIGNQLKADMFGAQVRSTEAQFNSQLKYNVNNANATRAFEAANINAGRQLEVAISNRAALMEVKKTNQAYMHQDRQRQRAEEAAARLQAQADAAAMARAQLSASTQMAAINAQTAQDQLALQQQQNALSILQQGINDARESGDAGSLGNLIANSPQIINGISDTIDTLNGWFS